MTEKELKLYEVAYLISPDYSEEEAQSFQQSLKNHVQSIGGLVEHEGSLAKRRLGYPIKNMWEAYLASFRFTLSPEKLDELKNKLVSKEVLRSLVVQTKRLPPRPVRERPVKTSLATQTKPTLQTAPQQPPASIEEIDKRLEEILGK